MSGSYVIYTCLLSVSPFTCGIGRNVWLDGVVLLGVLLSVPPPGPGDILLGPAHQQHAVRDQECVRQNTKFI